MAALGAPRTSSVSVLPPLIALVAPSAFRHRLSSKCGVSPVRNILRCSLLGSCSSRRLPLTLNAPDGRPQPLDALAGPAKTHRPCQDVANAASADASSIDAGARRQHLQPDHRGAQHHGPVLGLRRPGARLSNVVLCAPRGRHRAAMLTRACVRASVCALRTGRRLGR